MDINKIELPAALVSSLYHSSLVDDIGGKEQSAEVVVEKKAPTDDTGEKSEWKSLGHNQKNILVVVSSAEAVYLPDTALNFLTGILGACKLSLGDIALINIAHYPEVSFKELGPFFNAKITLLFDIEPASFGLPMSFPHYQIQPFAGSSFLYAPSLRELEKDRAEKTKLWNSLKRLFNL